MAFDVDKLRVESLKEENNWLRRELERLREENERYFEVLIRGEKEDSGFPDPDEKHSSVGGVVTRREKLRLLQNKNRERWQNWVRVNRESAGKEE